MLDEFSASSAEARLGAAVQSGQLSAAAQTQAETLLDRLARGVCVLFLGPKSGGKSQLCNALVGQALDPAERGFIRVLSDASHVAKRFEVLGDVRSVRCAGHDFSQSLFVDMATCQNDHESDARLRQSLELADVVLWCTERFGPQEAKIWAEAPDALKDHSFLVLTKADLSASLGDLATRIAALQPIVEEEFHSLFPVATSHVQKLLEQSVPVTDSDLAASGVKALADALQSVVASGQRADLDSALLFLERHGLLDGAAPEPPVAEPPAQSIDQKLPFKKARDAIMARALDLAEMSFDDHESDLSGVLDLCGTISEELTDILRDAESDVPEVAPWCRAFEEASDKIMLMALENDTRSAADAVTILLQMRRDLEHNSIN